jgi:hypothetical protein
MGKKNLDSILVKDEKILPKSEDQSLLNMRKKKAKKHLKERDSEILSIKITPSEMALLVEKKEREAGKMAPLGTYVKDYLRTKTSLLSKQ